MKGKIVLLLGLALVAGSSQAADSYWSGTTGSWTNAANWSGLVPGGNTDYAYITSGTAQITPGAIPAGAIAQTKVGGASGASLEISGNTDFKDFYIADAVGQIGTVNQTAGAVTFTGNLTTHIGRNGAGTYNLSGGTLTHTSTTDNDTHTFIGVYDGAVGELNISGTGAFAKNGAVAQKTILGYANGSLGTINLTDSGSFSQAVAANSYVVLGDNIGASGIVNISDSASYASGYTFIGEQGYGEVNQSGGTFYADCYYLRVGDQNGSEGIVNLSGGTFDKSNNGHLYIGEDTGSKGTVNMTGGVLEMTGTYISVGRNGTGVLVQEGGDIAGRALIMGNGTGSGVYTVSGGSLDLAEYLLVGANNAGPSEMVLSGSGADHLDINKLDINGHTLTVELDAGGSTLMTASGTVTSHLDGTLQIDTLAGFNGTVGSVYDIAWASAGFDNTNLMTFVDLSSGYEFDWSIVDNVAADGSAGTGQMLVATVIPEPGTLGLFALLGGAMLWVRRKFP